MTSIEVSIDLSAGTAQVSGPISNADNVQIVLKDYAENVTDGSRVRIVRGCHVLITGGTVTVSGDNGVCLLNTNSDEVKKLAESMRCPSQVGVEIVVDDTEDESIRASGRALLLLNWVEVGGGGVGGWAVQDGAVPITNIDELPSRYRESDMRNKINEIARVISGRAVLLTAILAPFALFGVGVNVYTAQKDQVWNDERIVTNVTFDAEGLVTSIESATNYVDSATNALSASLSEKISDSSESATNYTDSSVADLYESFSDKIVEISSESKSYTDMATNALSAKIPVVDLAPYATKTWVQSQGYLDSGSVDGVATKEWVSQQDFLTTLALTPYATIEWVIGRGYATPSVTNGLASMKWVEAKDYAAKSWVDGKGYATPSVTNGLAGESWVMSRGFVTKSVTNGLATRTWVEQKDYATEKWVNDKGYVTKSVTNGLAGKTWVTSQGYVTKSITNGLAAKTWVEHKGYLPSESAKRTYATKDELDALKRMYADTNGVTRLWSEDGLTMTDGTGVVWNVTWNVVTNWTSLSNGVVFAQFYDESMDYTKWVSQGIYTNAAGKSSSAAIEISSGIFSVWLDAHAGSTGTFDISDGQILVEAHDYGYNDTFSNSTVRVPAFTIRSRIVTNAVGYVTGGGIDTNAVLGLITSATNELEGVGTDRQIIRGSNQYGPWDITVFNAQTAQTAQGDSDGRPIIDTYAEKSEVKDLRDQVNSLGQHYNELDGSLENMADYVGSLAGTIGPHVVDTNNPHKVTAAQVGALPLEGGTVTGNLILEVGSGVSSPTLEVSGVSSSGIKLNAAYGGKITVGAGSNGGGQIVIGDSSVTGNPEAEVTIGTVKVRATLTSKADKATTLEGYGITNAATEAYVDDKVRNAVLPTNPTFSNAVLSVGLNIDTNSVAVLNEIAETFGGFPIEGTATTVGGLLAALVAAVAWLKKNKVGSFASVGSASATVENGVAKLDDFFTNSNSLLTGTIDARLPYTLYAVPSTGVLKDRAINTTSLASVTVPDNFTDLLIRASVASSLSVTMPEAIATKYGDTFPGEAGEYLITITKTGAAEAYVRTIKLEVANA